MIAMRATNVRIIKCELIYDTIEMNDREHLSGHQLTCSAS